MNVNVEVNILNYKKQLILKLKNIVLILTYNILDKTKK